MFALALACTVALVGQGRPSESGSEALRERYRAQAGELGRTANGQVRLALWCESHGLEAERVEHLARAILADPANAAARGLLGLIADAGQWRKPEAVAARVKADAEFSRNLAEYNSRRETLVNTPSAQWRMALWCESHGLNAEATTHLAAVVRKDPRREAAWRKLGYKRRKDGRWATEEQVAAAKVEAEAQRQADAYWGPRLQRLQRQLGLKENAKAREAEDELARIVDVRATPSVLRVFGAGGPASQTRAVQVLGQLDAPRAAKALALLAVFGKSPEVSRAATETLRRRDPRDYGETLLAMIGARVRYEVRPVGGPGSPGVLWIEGKAYHLQRVYAPPPPPNFPIPPGSFLTADASGLPVLSVPTGSSTKGYTHEQAERMAGLDQASEAGERAAMAHLGLSGAAFDRVIASLHSDGSQMFQSTVATDRDHIGIRVTRLNETMIPVGQMLLQAQTAAVVAEQQLEADVSALDAENRVTDENNARVMTVLNGATGQNLKADPDALKGWWAKQLGYSLATPQEPPTPTLTEEVPLLYEPRPLPIVTVAGPVIDVRVGHSCFGAGTSVLTIEGRRPIESLHAGDLVLTQDPASGTLTFQPILLVYHNPPNETLRLSFGEDAVVATPIHRFWKVGQGWTMARDLKVGDAVRLLGSVARLDRVVDDPVQPVFNLEVAKGQSYFVGNRGLLVHDNSVVLPTPTRFDAEAVASTGTGR